MLDPKIKLKRLLDGLEGRGIINNINISDLEDTVTISFKRSKNFVAVQQESYTIINKKTGEELTFRYFKDICDFLTKTIGRRVYGMQVRYATEYPEIPIAGDWYVEKLPF